MNFLKLLITLGLSLTILLLPLTPAITIQTVQNTHPNNPLFNTRITRITSPYQPSQYRNYIGQNTQTSIPVPSRVLITSDNIDYLIQNTQKLPNANPNIQHKWIIILDLLSSLTQQLNSYYRENKHEINQLLTKYRQMNPSTLEELLYTHLEQIPINDLKTIQNSQPNIQHTQNITSGIICNITSGSICSITSQPICALTLHPICTLITMTPMCNTMMGIRCPTAGIKCVPPTTGVLCLFLKNLGPIFKALLVITIIGILLFLPAIALITLFAPDTCTNLKNRITACFNCSTTQTPILGNKLQ